MPTKKKADPTEDQGKPLSAAAMKRSVGRRELSTRNQREFYTIRMSDGSTKDGLTLMQVAAMFPKVNAGTLRSRLRRGERDYDKLAMRAETPQEGRAHWRRTALIGKESKAKKAYKRRFPEHEE